LLAGTKSVVRYYDLIFNVFSILILTGVLSKYDFNGNYSAAMKHCMKAIQGHTQWTVGTQASHVASQSATKMLLGDILKLITVNLE
jgi:hypothetical protein